MGAESRKLWFETLPHHLDNPIPFAETMKKGGFDEGVEVAHGRKGRFAKCQRRGLIELYGTDEVLIQLIVRALYWRCITFTIDTDLDWVRAYISEAGYRGAVRILRDLIQN
ncbi:Uncharacterized protein TCAP_07262 [Tolypocladium capitatum]|uniref:Uncharacterized protein n=1 Tax=Tolypocladium capitatum TaxID=45235 RepID=A0A2K3Q0Y4_9HYPO|nr:Uncharacterized protein TCAP_07262 [Tolypocladium capitatum]